MSSSTEQTSSLELPSSNTTSPPSGRQGKSYEDVVGGGPCCVQQSSSSSLSSPSLSRNKQKIRQPSSSSSSSPPPPRITVVLFCGLPASGKSTLAKRLKHHLLSDPKNQYYCPNRASTTTTTPVVGVKKYHDVHLIEYDEIEEEQLQHLLRPMGGAERERFEKRRLKTDTEIDEITQQDAPNNNIDDDDKNNRQKCDDIGNGDNDEDESSEIRRAAWKRAREAAVQRLEQIITDHYGEDTTDTAENSEDEDDRDTVLSRQQQQQQRRTTILMDDNFHLRGMRKQIHRLLHRYKENKTSRGNQVQTRPTSSPGASVASTTDSIDFNFGIIWINSSVECCIERNNHRRRLAASSEQQRREVPTTQVITKMNDVFEPPRAVWESNHIIVKTEDMKQADGRRSLNYDGIDIDEKCLERVASFVVECPRIIDIPNDDEDGEEYIRRNESARETTRQNQVHNLDQTLRTWVGTVAKFDKALARAANDSRKRILQGSRSCSTSITTDSEQQEGSTSMTNFMDLDDLKTRFVDLIIPTDAQQTSLRSSIFKLLQ